MYKIISCSVKWMPRAQLLSAFLLQCIQFTRGLEGVMLSWRKYSLLIFQRSM